MALLYPAGDGKIQSPKAKERKQMKTQEKRFGYGRVKYHKENDFPSEIDYNGCN